ncbi:MAG: tRNA pseudouridine(13) synthase TruD [Candidatus Thalassarchaeum sp.]|nr:tRNA pseudouridine(13) synthase TruD [Candidatus Thalassarchaeum sp.]MEC9350713.1 tRNA pseudouridine(13) synthase TruD [Candidatus Thermoplasmatota archaeon]
MAKATFELGGDEDIERYLGLHGWAHDSPGIGGLLKVRIEDFRVEEVSRTPALDNKGRFTVVRATLRNWETNRYLRRLAGACRINRNRIFSSGLKDKRAVTTQLLVIDAPRHKVESVEIPDSELEILGRTHQKVGMSDHDGNRFTITVRGCCDEDGSPLDAKEAMRRVLGIREGMAQRLGDDAFPNWIGPQRFGATRPVTPRVGRAVVEGDFEKAVDLYLGMPGTRMTEDVSVFRKMWLETKDAAACLEVAPDHLGYEKSILEVLSDNPDNHVKAFRALPPSLQLLTIHSLQSLAFNHSLAGRLEAGLDLLEPEMGDLVAPIQASGRVDVSKMALVTETNLERCKRNCKLGRLAVTGPLPGQDVSLAQGEPGKIEAEALQTTNLHDTEWRVARIPNLSTSGTRRPLSVAFRDFSVEEASLLPEESSSNRWDAGPIEGERWHPEGADLRLRFTLPPGTYATVLMREFMRSPLDHY